MSKPVDELDEILYDFWAKHRYCKDGCQNTVDFEGEGTKARLLQWGTRQRIETLRTLKAKFSYDPSGTYIGELHRISVARDVEAIHETIDMEIAELQASLKDGENQLGEKL